MCIRYAQKHTHMVLTVVMLYHWENHFLINLCMSQVPAIKCAVSPEVQIDCCR